MADSYLQARTRWHRLLALLTCPALLSGCHAYQRARLQFLVSHPWEVIASRYFILFAVVIVCALVAVGVLLHKLSRRE
jgi:hypothetical protein